jgi:hypothetical protein
VDGRYRVRQLIGHGTSSAVYEAFHIELEHSVALKVCRHTGETASSRLVQEARLLAGINHPGIVRVFDTGVLPGGYRFLAMELLKGCTLAQWLAKIPLKLRNEHFITRCLSLLADVCDALAAVHARGVVHRDLKPANIFLMRIGPDEFALLPKLIDFSTARTPGGAADGLTHTGELVGTVAYMAPEQMDQECPSTPVDIFSLGVTLYNCLTDALPRLGQNENVEDALWKLRRDTTPVALPSSVNQAVLPRLDQVCLQAMARDPKARHAGVRQLGRELRDIAAIYSANAAPGKRGCGGTSKVSKTPVWRTVLPAGAGAVFGALAVAVFLGSDLPGHVTSARQAQVQWPRPAEKNVVWTPLVFSRQKTRGLREDKGAHSLVPRAANAGTHPSFLGDEAEAPELPRSFNAAEFLELADAFAAQGDWMQAYDLYERAFRAGAARPGVALYGMGRAAMEQRDYSKARTTLAQAVALESRPVWRLLLGRVFLIQGDRESAREQWEAVAKQDSDSQSRSHALQRLRELEMEDARGKGQNR